MLRNIIHVFAITIVVSTFIVALNVSGEDYQYLDFKSYITAADILKSKDRTRLYDVEVQSKYQHQRVSDHNILLPFRGLPPLAALFVPITAFDYITAYKIFMIINLFIAVAVVLFNRKILSKNQLFTLLCLFFVPIYTNLFLGQIIFFYFVIFLLIYRALKHDQIFIAGLFSGLLVLRPQYLLFIPFVFYMTNRYKKFMAGFLASATIILILSLWLVGLVTMLYYPYFLSYTEAPYYGSHISAMFGFPAFFKIFLDPFRLDLSLTGLMVLNFCLYFLIYFVIRKRFKNVNLEYRFSSALLLMLAFLGHAHRHDLVLFLIPLFFVLTRQTSFLALSVYAVINFGFKLLTPFFLVAMAINILFKDQITRYLYLLGGGLMLKKSELKS